MIKNVAVVFWTGTGNIEAMANAVAEGAASPWRTRSSPTRRPTTRPSRPARRSAAPWQRRRGSFSSR